MSESHEVFECRQCGDCCFGRGGVRLTAEEAEGVAVYLDLKPAELARLYLAPGEPPWEIRPDLEGYCLFRQASGLCLIHPVKPPVCRRWPFLPGPMAEESAFLDAREACPGLRRDASWDEFKAAGAEEE